MANLLTNMYDSFMIGIAGKLAQYLNDPLGVGYSIQHDYYSGNQRPQLKNVTDPKTGAVHNDNIMQNFVGLVVDRSVSRLFSGGLDFELPEGSDAQKEYLDAVWDLNKKEILLMQVGLYGATDGTCYIKIRPGATIDPFTGKLYPKLVALNPRLIRVKTSPEDVSMVEEYKIEFTYAEERNGRMVEVLRREITHRDAGAWVIDEYEQVGSGAIQLLSSIAWDYNFPPIIHWKNLPSLEGCYGDSEIDDIINIQDKANFTVSNTGKIIKHHASPTPTITGTTASRIEGIDMAVGRILVVPDVDAKVGMLEAQSDLASSRAFANDLHKSIFDISREVDPSSVENRIGTLTNFGVRVLYTDAINKNDTKRRLYGDALLELNRCLLVLAGWEGEASRPGTISWGEALPINILEEMQADEAALRMGVVDKETVANRYFSRYGVEWETIQANRKAQEPEHVEPVQPQDINQESENQ